MQKILVVIVLATLCSRGLAIAQDTNGGDNAKAEANIKAEATAGVNKPSEAELSGAFEKAEVAHLAAKIGTEERGAAAAEAAQGASKLAWYFLDAGQQDKAAQWFARAATLDKEMRTNRLPYWAEVLATDVPKTEAMFAARIQEWKQKAATAPDDKQKQTASTMLRLFTSMHYIARYNAVSMLEMLTREGGDNAAWLKYQGEELRIRRLELADLTEMGASQSEIENKNGEVAKALERLAWAQQKSGLWDEAEKGMLAALALRQSLPENSPARCLSDAYDGLGDFYFWSQGDLKKARQYYEMELAEVDHNTALQIQELEADAGYTPEIKATMSGEEKTQHEARQTENKNMTVVLGILSKSSCLIALSRVAQQSGDYRSAIDLAERTVALNKTLPPLAPGLKEEIQDKFDLVTLSQLSFLHAESGETDLAIQEREKSASLKRRLSTPGDAAQELQATGKLFYEREQFASAKPYFEQARLLYTSQQDSDGVMGATVALSKVARETGHLDEALSRAQEALSLARQSRLSTNMSRALRTLASVQLKQNAPDAAQKSLDEAEKLDAGNTSVLNRITTLSLQGQTLEALQQNDAALAKYKQAIGLLEGVRATTQSQASFSDIKENYQIYERAVLLLIRTGHGQEAFEYLSRAKSKQLQDSLSLSSIKSQDPKVRGQLDNANNLDARLHAIVAQLEAELAKPADQQDAAKIRTLQIVRAQTQGEFFAVLDDLKKKGQQFDVRVEPADVKAIQKRIPTDAILIQYAPLGDKLFIFLFTRTDLKIIETGTDPNKVWELIKAVRPQLARDGGGRGARLASAPAAPTTATASLDDNLTALYDLLIAPIEGDIASKNTLAFIPTQWLYYLPMQILAKKQDGQLHYLIDDKNVVYLATTGQISKAMLPRDADELGTGLLAFGDPTGANLPAAKVEVDTIGPIFKNSEVLSGAQVIKTAVMNDKNWDRRIVHFATHGILDSNAPDQSYIQLSPGASAVDGELTVGEIQGLPLDKVDVVTLSACQTALGEREPGREIMTLAGAFERAGAYSVVASLWSVADDSTKDLMVEFYTQLAQGKSKAEALRMAQLKVRQNPQFSHPYYWAPFLLMGDWR